MRIEKPRVCVVTATLKLEVGKATVNEALHFGGIPSVGYVVEDSLRSGGTKTANRGLEFAFKKLDVPYICYINDDVSFTKSEGWLRELVHALDENPTFGVVGAGGKCRTTPQCYAKPGAAHGMQRVYQLSFFCVVFRREVFEQLGFLDEHYIHYGCDSDYNRRIHHAGWKLGWVRHVWVEHHLGSVIKSWKTHDSALYQQRWSS